MQKYNLNFVGMCTSPIEARVDVDGMNKLLTL